jgi:hypothetical protein
MRAGSLGWTEHSRQSAKLSLQSIELGPPPLTRRRVLHCCPPFGSGRTHLFAGEGVDGPNSDEGTDPVVL